MLTGVSSVLALTLLIPTANADTLSELQQEQKKVEQKQNELNSGISDKSNEMNQNQTTLESIKAKIREMENQIQDYLSKINRGQGESRQTTEEIGQLQKSTEGLE